MALAASDAQGMQREGNVVAGQFQEGQTLEGPFQLSAGKCYAVLAVGVGVMETDLTLVASVPGMNPVLAQDQGSGPKAVLGGGGNCYKLPIPAGPFPVAFPAKFVVRASKGAGVIAAQLYVK
jgi:hypothetical protein